MPEATALLAWYDRHRRALPWRGPSPDPYRVWLSEIMLQQTTVAAVAPRYARFLSRYPTVDALAAAPIGDVLEEWAGLGYYARARNLHATARAVVAAGGFPRTEAGLRALPGIGVYTAAAIAAIAFDAPALPVDGNVERVAARLFAIDTPLPAARQRLATAARTLLDDPAARERPGDFAQALFDLGATVCTPRTPSCVLCPWHGACAAAAAGIAATLPRKLPKPERAVRFGTQFCVFDSAGRVLLRRRPTDGLFGGMLELPGTPWRDTPWLLTEALAHAPLPGLRWHAADGVARHALTHRSLTFGVLVARVAAVVVPAGMELRHRAEAAAALPTAMRKVLALADAALDETDAVRADTGRSRGGQ